MKKNTMLRNPPACQRNNKLIRTVTVNFYVVQLIRNCFFHLATVFLLSLK